jgi:hypothetical protein
MANKFIIPAPPIVGVAASANATLDLPVGPRYHVAWLEVVETAPNSAVILADSIGKLKVKLNGRTQREYTATQLNALNTLMGPEYAATVALNSAPNVPVGAYDPSGAAILYAHGNAALNPGNATTAYITRLPIFFAEPWRKQYAAGDMMAWPTSWPAGKGLVGTFQLEITLGAYATAAAAKVEIDYQPGAVDANGNPILLISKTSVLTTTLAVASSVEQYFTTLPRNEIYQQISFFAASSNITFSELKIKLENNLIRDCTKGTLDASNIARGMNPARPSCGA